MPLQTIYTARPDAKGRICLGDLAKGISRFKISTDKHCRIILEPFVEIPIKEKWLLENHDALSQVKRGIKESAEKEITSIGNFSKYAEDDLE